MSKRLIQFTKVFIREVNKRFQLTPEKKSKDPEQSKKKPKPEKSLRVGISKTVGMEIGDSPGTEHV